jgi:hypothetical protein
VPDKAEYSVACTAVNVSLSWMLPATVLIYLIICQLWKLASTEASSRQWVQSFTSLQNCQLLLSRLGNIPTHWNLAFIMHVQALCLQPKIDYWTSAKSGSGLFADLHLFKEEWDHVCHLVALDYPYHL